MFKMTYKLKRPVVNANGLHTLESVSFRPLCLQHTDLKLRLNQFYSVLNPIIDNQLEVVAKHQKELVEQELSQLETMDTQKRLEYDKKQKKERAEAEKLQSDPEKRLEMALSLYLYALKKVDGKVIEDILKSFLSTVEKQADSPRTKDHLIVFNDGDLILENFQTEAIKKALLVEDVEELLSYFLLLGL